MTAPMVDRRHSLIGRLHWELRRGPWGLLVLLALHQVFTAIVLGVDTYLLGYSGIPVPLPIVWPIVFLTGGLGALDLWMGHNRNRVALAEGLMLLAYGSRSMALTVSGAVDGWEVSKVIGVVTWAVMVGVAHRAWDDARAAT